MATNWKYQEQIPTLVVSRGRILVVDDDPSIASMLAFGLVYEGHQVSAASSGREAVEAISSKQHDLIILDLKASETESLEVCSRIRTTGVRVPILMLSSCVSTSYQVQALQIGADDFLAKPFPFQVLLAKVRALLRRVDVKPSDVLRFADLVLNTTARSVRRGEREIELTLTEYELLLRFMRQPRQVLAKEELLHKVWGRGFEGGVNILEVYVGYLRAKLEAEGAPRLIQTIRGSGYLLREPRQEHAAGLSYSITS